MAFGTCVARAWSSFVVSAIQPVQPLGRILINPILRIAFRAEA
jgi:hypothetical protein